MGEHAALTLSPEAVARLHDLLDRGGTLGSRTRTAAQRFAQHSEGGAVRPVTSSIVRADGLGAFSCGVASIDRYFSREALDHDARDIAKTFVLRSGAGAAAPVVRGFHTLGVARVLPAPRAGQLESRLAAYAMNVAVLHHLAVDERLGGRRFGEALLMDALLRASALMRLFDCTAVIAKAPGRGACSFYEAYDFATLDHDAHVLLPAAAITSLSLS